jgi:hypothetical protein
MASTRVYRIHEDLPKLHAGRSLLRVVQSDTAVLLWRPMPPKKKLSVKLSPVVATTVIRPVATRLNRIEDLLIEMRGALDFHLKRIAALQKQVDILIENDRVRPSD